MPRRPRPGAPGRKRGEVGEYGSGHSPRIVLTVPRELLAEVERAARAEKVSLSAWVRQAMRDAVLRRVARERGIL